MTVALVAASRLVYQWLVRFNTRQIAAQGWRATETGGEDNSTGGLHWSGFRFTSCSRANSIHAPRHQPGSALPFTRRLDERPAEELFR